MYTSAFIEHKKRKAFKKIDVFKKSPRSVATRLRFLALNSTYYLNLIIYRIQDQLFVLTHLTVAVLVQRTIMTLINSRLHIKVATEIKRSNSPAAITETEPSTVCRSMNKA